MQFLALASLLPTEFDERLTDFAPRWEWHHRYHILDGDRRRIPAHPDKVFTCDGVERGISPNAGLAGQKEGYSAKRVHALKNSALSDDTQYLQRISG